VTGRPTSLVGLVIGPQPSLNSPNHQPSSPSTDAGAFARTPARRKLKSSFVRFGAAFFEKS